MSEQTTIHGNIKVIVKNPQKVAIALRKARLGLANKIMKYVVGKIKRRTHQQTDMHGRPFHPYSTQYRKALGRAGQDQRIDMRLNGWMMDSIGLRKTEAKKDRLTVIIGPNIAQMPKTKLSKGGRKRTSGSRPANNALAYYHHTGKGRLPKRQFLGLTKKEKDALKKYVQNMIRKALK
tara:strand:+ start:3918 stop:4451 length:534 start_codon:yes stop_codon:yes gene_type:complete